ncbi:ABC-type Mn2+/Zn2+ transport systems, permease components [Methanoculleus bourgensis MS2]|uniref:ABC-type Mn2+/Zn2+ transport systems, permease components n=2 Tax=Methanoculleus bourgensis TaxID=83986 RepID=I7L167_METBM|nr:metal ABC transporter permease [Methanoculleus bourgensis]CCJ37275.1 ABC-type Mn2+/Zn2+ transport systems, permease components [Methanoculleus bourgensis MS2]CVK34338.1 Chelated iron transport system membrane protein yfeD [Methanoculleus bourgensis]
MLEFLIPNNVVCHAVEAMLLASIACSILSVIIVQINMGSIGFTMAHAAFAGAAVGIFLSLNPTLTAIIAGLAVAGLLGPLSDRAKVSADTALGALFGTSMAVAVFFIAYLQQIGRGFDASGLLFGDVISLYREEIYALALISIVAILFVTLFSKEITAIIFDRRIAEAAGIRVRPVYYALLFMIAMTVALSLNIVGGLLLYIWLVMPAVIVLQFCRNIRQMFIAAPIVAACISVIGALAGLNHSLPVAPLTALLFGVVFAFAVIVSPRRRITVRKS